MSDFSDRFFEVIYLKVYSQSW